MANAWTNEWPAELDAKVIQLRDEHLTYEEIGKAIGKTRSAVSGRLRRLGHAQPAVRLTPEERLRRKRECDRAYKARVAGRPHQPFVMAELLNIEPRYVPILDLQKNECRWPYGDGPFTFCGCPAEEAKPYCLPHMQQATEPTRVRVRA